MTDTPTGSQVPDRRAGATARAPRGSSWSSSSLTVPDGDQRSAARALHMDPLNAEVSQVFFLDTRDLLLNERGLIVRVRAPEAATTP